MAVDLEYLRVSLQDTFLRLIDSISGAKDLVIEPELSSPLSLLVKHSVLKSHGVAQMYHLRGDLVPSTADQTVYLIRRTDTNAVRAIIEHMRSAQSNSIFKAYHLIFVPIKCVMCERILEEEGLFGNIRCYEFPMEMIPLDTDVLSMDMPHAFRECFLEGDFSSLWHVANAISQIEQRYGRIPNISGKGFCAQYMLEMLQKSRMILDNKVQNLALKSTTRLLLMPQYSATSTSTSSTSSASLPATSAAGEVAEPQIGHLIVIDRASDLLTPLCTQLTYEGLIDEAFNINHMFVEVNKDLIISEDDKRATTAPATPAEPTTPATANAPPAPKPTVKVLLSNDDPLFCKLRDMNFACVGSALHEHAKSVSETLKEREHTTSLSDLRRFVAKLPSMTKEQMSLRVHVSLVEQLIDYTRHILFQNRLEMEQRAIIGDEIPMAYLLDTIYRKDSVHLTLRMMCLKSVAEGGIKEKDLELLWKEFLQCYGYNYMFTLINLSKVGLLTTTTGSTTKFYSNLRKKLKLAAPCGECNAPTDFSFVHNDYAPFSVRLVEHYARKNGSWKGLSEVLQQIPGPLVDLPDPRRATAVPSFARACSPTTLLFFIGGVTRSEIAAIRWLTQQGLGPFIIATTSITSGFKILTALVDAPDPSTYL